MAFGRTTPAAGGSVNDDLLSLVDAMGRQDRQAIEQFVREAYPAIVTYAARRGADTPEALGNQVLSEFLQKLGDLQFESSGQIWSYLYRVANSRIIDDHRRSRPEQPRPDIQSLDQEQDGFDHLLVDGLWLDELLSSLTRDQREVIELRFLKDLSIEETALKTGKTQGAVKGLQHRALAVLAATAAAIAALLIVLAAASDLFDGSGDQRLDVVNPADEAPPPGADERETPVDGGGSGEVPSLDQNDEISELGGVDVNDSGRLAPPVSTAPDDGTDEDAEGEADEDAEAEAATVSLVDETVSWSFAGAGRSSRIVIDVLADAQISGASTESPTLSITTPTTDDDAVTVITGADGRPRLAVHPTSSLFLVDYRVCVASVCAEARIVGAGTWYDEDVCATPPDDASVIVGTDGDDDLTGTDGDDLIFGGGGNDTISGGGGNDFICAGDGADIVYGGGGNDTIFGQAGNDDLEGELGDDLVIGGSGSDALYGNSGNDRLYGGDGDDWLHGAADNDELFGEGGTDTLRGGSGENVLVPDTIDVPLTVDPNGPSSLTPPDDPDPPESPSSDSGSSDEAFLNRAEALAGALLGQLGQPGTTIAPGPTAANGVDGIDGIDGIDGL